MIYPMRILNPKTLKVNKVISSKRLTKEFWDKVEKYTFKHSKDYSAMRIEYPQDRKPPHLFMRGK